LHLKSGYSTGVYTCAIFKSALLFYLTKLKFFRVDIKLPIDKVANIKIDRVESNPYIEVTATKGNNDDIDVTKKAKISLILSEDRLSNLTPIKQTPHILQINQSKIYIFASFGVGVVTKRGLKIEPYYPAINPTPLKMIKEVAKEYLKDLKRELFIYISVKDGLEIAKKTANEKVGVIGGISILGTTGIVKPVSSQAYLDSIKTEIDVIEQNSKEIVLTLGSSSYNFAKKNYKESEIVEIGNFIFDSINYIKNLKRVVFISQIAKMAKVSQSFKNTHNRYGFLDFNRLKLDYNLNIDTTNIKTIKAVLELLSEKELIEFQLQIVKNANRVLKEWNPDIEIETIVVSKKIIFSSNIDRLKLNTLEI